MRSRLVAIAAVGLVSLGVLGGLHSLDNRLEEDFRLAAPQLDAPKTATAGAAQTPVADREYDPVVMSTDLQSWEIENRYIFAENFLRQGWGPELRTQVDIPVDDGVITILAVGDSYVWGEAIEDLDMRWPQVLERKLNKTGTGRYRVVNLGRLPASLMQEIDWITPERLAKYNVDAVVLGYLRNDVIPTFEESNLCEQYATCTKEGETPVKANPRNGPLVDCLRGQDSPMSWLLKRTINPYFPYVGRWLTNRYCDPDRVAQGNIEILEGRWIENPAESPHWGSIAESIERLGRNLGETPAVVLDLNNAFWWTPGHTKVKELFTAAGIHVQETANADRLGSAAANIKSELDINPADNHPGPKLTHAYADDAIEALKETLPALKQSNTPAPTAATERPLVSNWLPTTLTVEATPTSFSASGGPRPDGYLDHATADGVPHGYQLLTRYVPCARINRPHARIMLDPERTNYQLTLTLRRSDEPLVIVPVGYESDGQWVQGEPRVLTAGDQVTFDMGEKYRGILVGKTRGNCLEAALELPRFTLEGNTRQYSEER